METGAEAAEGSQWVREWGGMRGGIGVDRDGETEKIEKDCEPSGAEESTSGHLTQA